MVCEQLFFIGPKKSGIMYLRTIINFLRQYRGKSPILHFCAKWNKETKEQKNKKTLTNVSMFLSFYVSLSILFVNEQMG